MLRLACCFCGALPGSSSTTRLDRSPAEPEPLAHRYQRADDKSPNHERKHGFQKVKSKAYKKISAGRNEIQDAVVASQLAPAQPGLRTAPMGIDEILRKGSGYQDRQRPRKDAAPCPRKQPG